MVAIRVVGYNCICMTGGDLVGTQLPAEVKGQVNDLIEERMRHTLARLGIDYQNHLEVQRDMAALRELRLFFTNGDVQSDLQHLREMRLAMSSVKRRTLVSLSWMFVLGIITLVALGLRSWVAEVLATLSKSGG